MSVALLSLCDADRHQVT